MKKLINNYLCSGHLFHNYEESVRYKFLFLNYVIGVASLVAFIIGIFRFAHHNYLMASFDVVFSIITLIFLYKLRKNKENIELISTQLLLLSYILFLAIFTLAVDQASRLSVFFLLIFSAYFLKGKRIGLYWLIAVIVPIGVIQFFGLAKTYYSHFDVFAIFLYFGVAYFILNLYETVKENQTNDLIKLNINLENLVDERTKELEKEKDRFEKLSVTDKLTGLYNRHYLESAFEYEKKQSRRHNTEYSIILIDLDNFKSINDTYGHNAGDLFLKEISNVLTSLLRETDTVGRWGGEEFLILLPKTDLEAAKEVAEKIRRYIEKTEFTYIGNRTASFGVATLNEDDDSMQSILNRADKALYKAKEDGRNRVEVSSI